MAIRAQCNNCGKVYNLPEENAGKPGKAEENAGEPRPAEQNAA